MLYMLDSESAEKFRFKAGMAKRGYDGQGHPTTTYAFLSQWEHCETDKHPAVWVCTSVIYGGIQWMVPLTLPLPTAWVRKEHGIYGYTMEPYTEPMDTVPNCMPVTLISLQESKEVVEVPAGDGGLVGKDREWYVLQKYTMTTLGKVRSMTKE